MSSVVCADCGTTLASKDGWDKCGAVRCLPCHRKFNAEYMKIEAAKEAERNKRNSQAEGSRGGGGCR